MPREPLSSIDSNIQKRKELTPYERGVIIGKHSTGCGPTKIATNLQIPRTTVQTTLKQEPVHRQGKSLPRVSRPKSYSAQDKRKVLIIKQDLFISYRDLQIMSGLALSRKTFYRILKASGYGKWRAKKRPRLTKKSAKIQYAWAKK